MNLKKRNWAEEVSYNYRLKKPLSNETSVIAKKSHFKKKTLKVILESLKNINFWNYVIKHGLKNYVIPENYISY